MKLSRAAYLLVALALCVAVRPASAQDKLKVDELINKFEASFEPAEAKPGQTVTLMLTVLVKEGWHIYPTVQPEKPAGSSVTKITFPTSGSILFVGKLKEPADAKSKPEPMIGVKNLVYYPEGGTWERKAVVLPTAKAGKLSIEIPVRLYVCNANDCYPKTKKLEVSLTVAGDPVAVDPAYKAEVEKAAKP